MTEAEWVQEEEAGVRKAMAPLNLRQKRLLAMACCRVLSANFPPGAADWVEAIETYADTGKSKAALRRVRQAVRAERASWAGLPLMPPEYIRTTLQAVAAAAEERVTSFAVQCVLSAMVSEGTLHEDAQRRLYRLYHDIAGPISSILFRSDWRTSTVTALAQTMYDSRDFSAMPILADALQDAGCDNAAILDHCRGLGPHVRGCWVVDGCLGKS